MMMWPTREYQPFESNSKDPMQLTVCVCSSGQSGRVAG